jgi:hypothetical protein
MTCSPKTFADRLSGRLTTSVDSEGNRFWHLDGKLHREDGPAVEWADGMKEWWVNGLRHRTDGPAVTYPDGSEHEQWRESVWWVNGVRVLAHSGGTHDE